jgi:hypothetical protein
MVIQAALLAVVHAQPPPADTVTLAEPPPAVKDCVAGEMEGAQGAENSNGFETELTALPPGPTADTRASYTTPGAGGVDIRLRKLTRIRPSVPGDGLPRLTLSNGVVAPTRNSESL